MKPTIALALVAGLSTVSMAGFANSIEATFNGVSPGGTLFISHDAGESDNEVGGGLFNWSRTGGSWAGPGGVGNFISMCIETTEHIGNGNSYTYQVVNLGDAPTSQSPGMGNAKAALVRELFGRFYHAGMTSDEAVAMQAATWEIVNDDGLDLADGDFRVGVGGNVTAGIQTSIQNMLDALDGTGPKLAMRAMVGDGIQDQVFIVPTPGGMALLGMGGLVMARRRRG
jgi:hypothetical protein